MQVKIVKNSDEIDVCYDLRRKIFIEEQKVPVERERDSDDNFAVHFLLFEDKEPVGACRIVTLGNIAELGRFGILPKFRGNGAGLFFIGEIIKYSREKEFHSIILGAQKQAVNFYKKLDFEICGDEYMDANIPHFKMQLVL